MSRKSKIAHNKHRKSCHKANDKRFHADIAVSALCVRAFHITKQKSEHDNFPAAQDIELNILRQRAADIINGKVKSRSIRPVKRTQHKQQRKRCKHRQSYPCALSQHTAAQPRKISRSRSDADKRCYARYPVRKVLVKKIPEACRGHKNIPHKKQQV